MHFLVVLLLLDTAGFKYVLDIIFQRPHIVAGMATAFAIKASCGALMLSAPLTMCTEGIAHLAFCLKVMTGLGWWAGAHEMEGYMGNLRCTLSLSGTGLMYMPYQHAA